MKVCALGDCCIDYYQDSGRYYPTGNAVDFAVHMRRLGYPVSLISAVGRDSYGSQTKKFLEKEKIDLSHLKTSPGKTAVTMMDLIDGDRIHSDYEEGVLQTLHYSSRDIEFARSHDLVHSVLWGKGEGILSKVKREDNTLTFDFADRLDSPLIQEIVPTVDHGFFSYHKGEDKWIKSYLENQCASGLKTAVATFGEKGSMALTKEGFVFQESLSVEVVNTVGAGDAFIAGFSHGLLKGLSVKECLYEGTKIASQVVTRFEPY